MVKSFRGEIIEMSDYSKIARDRGDDVEKEQIIKILLDEISDEEFNEFFIGKKVIFVLEA